MSIQIVGAEIGEAVQVAATVFSMLLMLVCGWFVYLMVRPSRRARDKARQTDPGELEEMWRIVDRMESRLEAIERAVSAEERAPLIARRPRAEDREDRLLSPAAEGRESGGKK